MRVMIFVNHARKTGQRTADIPADEDIQPILRAALIDFINATPLRVGDTIKIREIPA